MRTSIKTIYAVIILALCNVIITENLVHQADDWWKEFVHDAPALSMPSIGIPYEQEERSTQELQAYSNEDDVWDGEISKSPLLRLFSGHKKWITLGVVAFGSGCSGFWLHKWWWNTQGFSLQTWQAFNRAVARSDMETVKNMLGCSTLDPQLQIEIAARNETRCPICFDDIHDASKHQVATPNSLHFICADCKQECQSSGRTYRCPMCRVR